ncbi:hypothetical protein MMG00_01980 [Ignatzschineria rhizosphaerae]|uniref:Uncharacterized protein n=1 Tax=Ignatzschineria rhizosphaerae TaxID=2923279 RepID=A0ABY3X1C7_9GAMM|nr:hypothetical protein [Ignatzschineria rhizosphaerae]UNM96656.1 hypothetical protein MMG00_01980 [Ignatzschineria rhizosphaerae]
MIDLNKIKMRPFAMFEAKRVAIVRRLFRPLLCGICWLRDRALRFLGSFIASDSKKLQNYRAYISQKRILLDAILNKKIFSGRYRCNIGENSDDEPLLIY